MWFRKASESEVYMFSLQNEKEGCERTRPLSPVKERHKIFFFLDEWVGKMRGNFFSHHNIPIYIKFPLIFSWQIRHHLNVCTIGRERVGGEEEGRREERRRHSDRRDWSQKTKIVSLWLLQISSVSQVHTQFFFLFPLLYELHNVWWSIKKSNFLKIEIVQTLSSLHCFFSVKTLPRPLLLPLNHCLQLL